MLEAHNFIFLIFFGPCSINIHFNSFQEPKWEDSPNRSLHLLELPRYRLQRLGTYLSPGEEGPEQDKTEEEDKAGIAVPGSFFGIAGKAASQSWVNKSFIDFEQKLHHIQDLAEKTQEQQKRLQSDYDNLLQKQLQTKELENLQRRQDSMDKHSEQSARELEELQRRQDSMDKEQSDRLQKLEEEVAKDVSQVLGSTACVPCEPLRGLRVGIWHTLGLVSLTSSDFQ